MVFDHLFDQTYNRIHSWITANTWMTSWEHSKSTHFTCKIFTTISGNNILHAYLFPFPLFWFTTMIITLMLIKVHSPHSYYFKPLKSGKFILWPWPFNLWKTCSQIYESSSCLYHLVPTYLWKICLDKRVTRQYDFLSVVWSCMMRHCCELHRHAAAHDSSSLSVQ